MAAAVCVGSMPGIWGAGLKPYPGMEGATTWKAGKPGGGSVKGSSRPPTSIKEPGVPCMKRRGMALGCEEQWCTKWRGMGSV